MNFGKMGVDYIDPSISWNDERQSKVWWESNSQRKEP